MNEFVEKLIGRLEELKELHAELIKDGLEEDFHSGCEGMCVDIIEIVNQLAEEYKDKTDDVVKGNLLLRDMGAFELSSSRWKEDRQYYLNMLSR